jgi:uncharacterized membrane protein
MNMPKVDPHPEIEVLDIDMLRPMHWIAQAWHDMERSPKAGAAHGLILALVGLFLFWFARHNFWWIAGMLSVCMIVAPLLAVGLYDISRRLERGLPASSRYALSIWKSGDRRLVHFGLLLALSSAGWLICSAALIHAMMPAAAQTPAEFIRLVVLQPKVGLFEVWVLLSAFIAAPMFASTVVTIPLLMDHPTLSVWQAVSTSWRVVAKNPFAMACWASFLCLFTMLGIGSAFIGLIAVVPMLGHASWHAYRDLVVYDPEAH